MGAASNQHPSGWSTVISAFTDIATSGPDNIAAKGIALNKNTVRNFRKLNSVRSDGLHTWVVLGGRQNMITLSVDVSPMNL